jgi:hypothetical protein
VTEVQILHVEAQRLRAYVLGKGSKWNVRKFRLYLQWDSGTPVVASSLLLLWNRVNNPERRRKMKRTVGLLIAAGIFVLATAAPSPAEPRGGMMGGPSFQGHSPMGGPGGPGPMGMQGLHRGPGDGMGAPDAASTNMRENHRGPGEAPATRWEPQDGHEQEGTARPHIDEAIAPGSAGGGQPRPTSVLMRTDFTE